MTQPPLSVFLDRLRRILGFVRANRRRRILALILSSTLVAVAALGLGPRLLPKTPLAKRIPSSVAVYDANHALLRLSLATDEQYRLWLPLAQISPQLAEAVQLYEDRGFRWHPGVNPWSLLRAAATTVAGGRRIGGSTLTMQVARRLWRIDTRNVPGKLVQILRALQLEALYTKDEILEAYLNLVPYGGNVEGAGAASLTYFGKPAARLTLAEALTLAVIPQNPGRRGPGRAAADLTAARDRLYARWLETHREARQEAELFKLPVTVRSSKDLPFRAPHFVDALLAAEPRPAGEVVTTLDLKLQRILERQLRGYVERQRRVGVTNAAALLVDSRDMGIKAAIGSADWFDDAIGGQVSALAARRSPGSTLKPFIYALAMDQGLIHPATVLKDSPQSFGGYSPENFDGRFVGPLTATEALNRSRNVPAIALAARLAEPGLYGFLKAAEVGGLAPESRYGLALVLGGAEISMEDLARLYAILANRGEAAPLRSLAADKPTKPTQLISEEASFMVLDMLRQNPRPDSALVNADAGRLPVYWKTGTSYGFRDAWTAGVFGPYVLVVWLGNFDNAPNPALVGVQMAAPLFFEIVDAVAASQPGLREPIRHMPANLARVEVCAASGDLPNADCPQRAATWFIPGKSPIRVSTLHRRLTIDNASGRIACPPYRPGRTHEEVFEFWSSDMLALFRQAGLPRRAPPQALPGCTAAAEDVGPAPRITSPLRGVAYTLRLSKPEEQRIALQATVDAGVNEVFWFVGDNYLGKAPRGGSLGWQPPGPGTFVLRAVDDAGRADTREVTVSIAQ